MTMMTFSIQATELFSGLRKKSIRTVERTGWISRQTKSKLMQKLATTKLLASPPKFFLNASAVTSRLETVNITERDFFGNVLGLGRRQREWMFGLKK